MRDLLSRSRERSIPAHNRYKACCGLRVINASADNARRAERDLTRARGGGKLPTIDCHLTFTHHFRLRRSPHRGHMMRKRPLDSPRLSNLVFARSCSPLQRPRGGVPSLDFSFVCWCAARLNGLATLPEQRASLLLVPYCCKKAGQKAPS